MTTLIVLFNLKNPAAVADYERWAREVDIPTASSLPSVERFEVLKAKACSAAAPRRISTSKSFGSRIWRSSAWTSRRPPCKRSPHNFRGFADNPLFLLTDPL